MKHSRLELVKNLLGANQKRRRYAEHGISQSLLDSALQALVDIESSHPNSIEYSSINRDPAVIEAQFGKLKSWINELTNKELSEELKTVLFPLLCHLYIDMLIVGHKTMACSFLKKHQNVSSEEGIELLEELAKMECWKDVEGKSIARILRSSKYVVPLSANSLQVLKQYLSKKGHVVLLQVINDWFCIEEKQPIKLESNSDNTSVETNGFPENSHLKSPNDKELAKVEEIINLVNEGSSLPPPMLVYNINNPEECLSCARCCPSTKILAAGFTTSEIRLWNLLGKKLKSRSDCPGSKIRLASETDDFIDQEEDLPATEPYPESRKFAEGDLVLRGHSAVVQDVAFVQDTDILVSVSLDKTLRAWNLNQNTCAAIYRGHGYGIWCVDVGPLGMYVATGSHDRTAKLWSLERNYPLRVFAGHVQDVVCLRFHPNGSYLATGSPDKSIRLWSVSNGELVRVLSGHRATVFALAFSPNGSLLASAGDDKRIKIWDLASSLLVKELKGHSDSVMSLDWSPDGQFLVSAGLDFTARVWPVNQILKASDEETGSLVPKIYSQKCNSLCSTLYNCRNTPVCVIGSI